MIQKIRAFVGKFGVVEKITPDDESGSDFEKMATFFGILEGYRRNGHDVYLQYHSGCFDVNHRPIYTGQKIMLTLEIPNHKIEGGKLVQIEKPVIRSIHTDYGPQEIVIGDPRTFMPSGDPNFMFDTCYHTVFKDGMFTLKSIQGEPIRDMKGNEAYKPEWKGDIDEAGQIEVRPNPPLSTLEATPDFVAYRILNEFDVEAYD